MGEQHQIERRVHPLAHERLQPARAFGGPPSTSTVFPAGEVMSVASPCPTDTNATRKGRSRRTSASTCHAAAQRGDRREKTEKNDSFHAEDIGGREKSC